MFYFTGFNTLHHAANCYTDQSLRSPINSIHSSIEANVYIRQKDFKARINVESQNWNLKTSLDDDTTNLSTYTARSTAPALSLPHECYSTENRKIPVTALTKKFGKLLLHHCIVNGVPLAINCYNV